MRTLKIRLSSTQSVKDFVNVVATYPYDMDLRSGRHVVDAKSILGIFSFNLSQPLDLCIYADACDDLIHDLSPFTCCV